jgi:hypothetical protein
MWCEEVNAVTQSEICAVPDERVVAERDVTTPLRSPRARIGRPTLRKVDWRLSTSTVICTPSNAA